MKKAKTPGGTGELNDPEQSQSYTKNTEGSGFSAGDDVEDKNLEPPPAPKPVSESTFEFPGGKSGAPNNGAGEDSGETKSASDDSKATKDAGPSQKMLLLAAANEAEYWHDPEGEAYATIKENGGCKTHCKVRSKTFKSWLSWKVYKLFKCAPGSQPLEDTLRVLEARAKFDSKEFETHVRIAGDANTSFLHLADVLGTIKKIDAEGVVAWDAPDGSLKFLTKPGMKKLPVPVVPDDIKDARDTVSNLRNFCNLKDDDDWWLFVTALLSAFRPTGPFVVVVVVGEQGSAKSTLCKILRRLVDPSKAMLRSAPREDRDLWIAANNGWIIVFDNVSRLTQDLSDAICRLATGGGNSYRTLYENDQETLFQAQRLVLLNSIDELTFRGDLLDRAVRLTCIKIDEGKRRTEEEFWRSYEEQEAKILGALLKVLSETLKHLPNVVLSGSPRMADFARFGVAVEKAMGLVDGTFLKAYQTNRDSLVAVALENQLADLIISLDLPIEEKPAELWESLRTAKEFDANRLPKWFPVNPQQLSSQLRRLAPFLRQRGIEVDFSKSGSKRLITIRPAKTGTSSEDGSDPSGASDATKPFSDEAVPPDSS